MKFEVWDVQFHPRYAPPPHKPKETVFLQLFAEMGYVKLDREYGAYLCMLYHMIMDHTLDQLVD